MRILLYALALVGCRFGFDDEQMRSSDARGDGAATADAALGPFGHIVELAYLNDGASPDDDPSLTADMLELYFDSQRTGGMGMGDCWVATRASVSDPFGTPQLVAELASPADDTTFDVSPDGLTMYFGSDRAVAGNRDLYVATRVDRVSPWSAPVRIAELASPADDSGAAETADRLHLVFASGRGGSFDLYMATRTAVGQPWGDIAELPGLNTPSEESQQWTNADATLIYFVSDRPGSQSEDIWMASRSTPDAAFGPAQHLDELATAQIDADPWLSPDLHTIYFASQSVVDGTHLYMATR